MNGVTDVFRVFLVFVCFRCCYGRIPQYYVEDHCSQTLALDYGSVEAVKLKLTKSVQYPDGMQCTMRVQAPPGKKFHVRFQRFDIKGNTNFGCQTGDYMQLLDGASGQSSVLQGLPNRLCSAPTMKRFVTSNRYLVIRFMSDRDRVSGKGVQMVLTAFNEGPCTDEQFSCKDTGRCIQKSLTCDGTSSCDDQSDEAFLLCLTTAAIVGIAIGCSFVLIAIAIIIVLMCLRQRQKRRDRTIKLNYDRESTKISKSRPYSSANDKSTGSIRTGL